MREKVKKVFTYHLLLLNLLRFKISEELKMICIVCLIFHCHKL